MARQTRLLDALPGPWLAASALLALACAACTAPALPSCVDRGTASVFVEVRNPGDKAMTVPGARPNIGCCARTGLSVAITDGAGRELDRCAFSDNFDIPREVALQPGESIRYTLSEQSLSRVYCKVDLARQYVSVHHEGKPLGVQPLRPCPAAAAGR
jgi:hypothetical protein